MIDVWPPPWGVGVSGLVQTSTHPNKSGPLGVHRRLPPPLAHRSWARLPSLGACSHRRADRRRGRAQRRRGAWFHRDVATHPAKDDQGAHPPHDGRPSTASSTICQRRAPSTVTCSRRGLSLKDRRAQCSFRDARSASPPRPGWYSCGNAAVIIRRCSSTQSHRHGVFCDQTPRLHAEESIRRVICRRQSRA